MKDNNIIAEDFNTNKEQEVLSRSVPNPQEESFENDSLSYPGNERSVSEKLSAQTWPQEDEARDDSGSSN
jgi:hypothetical protein